MEETTEHKKIRAWGMKFNKQQRMKKKWTVQGLIDDCNTKIK